VFLKKDLSEPVGRRAVEFEFFGDPFNFYHRCVSYG
jgi:hypothetical protein